MPPSRSVRTARYRSFLCPHTTIASGRSSATLSRRRSLRGENGGVEARALEQRDELREVHGSGANRKLAQDSWVAGVLLEGAGEASRQPSSRRSLHLACIIHEDLRQGVGTGEGSCSGVLT